MVPDHDTNTVFISGLLPKRHPAVAQALKAALGDRLRTIPGTKDIWCRDFMPIQLAPDQFIQFRYEPDHLEDYPHLRTEDGARLLELTKDCVRSHLVIDGGNIVRWDDTAIMTDRAFDENIGHEPAALRQRLRKDLEVDRLMLIPQEPKDDIGHADGMVRFVHRDTVLVNDYSEANPAFGRRLAKELARHRLKAIPFPYCPTEKPGRDSGIASAMGVYINFLQVEGMILCPAFGRHEDDSALNALSKCFPRQQIIPLPCTDLAMGGGVLNCVTWNIAGLD
jgi:agmatine deiminase